MVLLAAVSLRAQQGSSTLIQTCHENTNCYHTKTPSFIYYDEGRAEMFIKMDLSQAGQDDSLGKWLQGIKKFQFVAALDKGKFPQPSNYHANYVTVNGITSVNGVSHQQQIDITIYQIEQGITTRPNNNNQYDEYRVDLSIPLVPEDYNLGSDLKGTVFISINAGIINQVGGAGAPRPD